MGHRVLRKMDEVLEQRDLAAVDLAFSGGQALHRERQTLLSGPEHSLFQKIKQPYSRS